MNTRTCAVIIGALTLLLSPALAEEPALPPRIDSVVPLDPQPGADDPAVIWSDDFNAEEEKRYGEQSGGVDREVAYGGSGGSMILRFEQGGLGTGNRKVFFGDSPTGNPVVRRGEHFREIYWRIYVKHQHGWRGESPAKMSRATSLVTPTWAQAMIGHVWDGGPSLAIDPATGVRNGQIVTTRYNDFPNLDWMRAYATARFPIHSTEESGYWVPVEARAKLNTPGQADGIFQLWLNGRLEAELTGLNWIGSYTDHGINAVFLEAHWDVNHSLTQNRWYDNFVISTQPIGVMYAERNPQIIKSVPPGRSAGTWQVQASRGDGEEVVWQSAPVSDVPRVQLTAETGEFLGSLAGQSSLPADGLYYLRIRRQSEDGSWSQWSHWHQPFRTAP